VRELKNIITRACVLSGADPITADQLKPWLATNGLPAATGRGTAHETAPTNPSPPPAPTANSQPARTTLPVGTPLDEVERRMIEATLAEFDGHRAKTAAALGIGVRTLSSKLRGYGYAPGERNFSQTG
jgi:DNA-binding NtrC family response regulator